MILHHVYQTVAQILEPMEIIQLMFQVLHVIIVIIQC